MNDIAIVGNAPITEEHMNEINMYKRVVRMNYHNNYRINDVVTDVVYRYKNDRVGFIGDLHLIEKASCVHFLNHNTLKCKNVMEKLTKGKKYVTYHKHIQEMYPFEHIDKPTTGYLVVLYMKHTHPESHISLYGFNWSTTELLKHHPNIEQEKQNIRCLPNVIIHDSLKGYHHTFTI